MAIFFFSFYFIIEQSCALDKFQICNVAQMHFTPTNSVSIWFKKETSLKFYVSNHYISMRHCHLICLFYTSAFCVRICWIASLAIGCVCNCGGNCNANVIGLNLAPSDLLNLLWCDLVFDTC